MCSMKGTLMITTDRMEALGFGLLLIGCAVTFGIGAALLFAGAALVVIANLAD